MDRKSKSTRKITSIKKVNDSGFSGYYDKTKLNAGVFHERKFSRNRSAKEFQTPMTTGIGGLG